MRWREGSRWKIYVEKLQKQTMGLIWINKFYVIDLVLTNRGNFSGTRPKSGSGKSSSSRCSFSAAGNAISKATDFVTFGFSFLTSLVSFPLKESLNVSVSKRYGFFSVLAAVIRTNPDKRPWIEDGEGFAAHTITWPRGAIDTIGAIPKINSPNTSCSWTCFAAKLIFWS